ncbi:VOC family protein [Sneathiella marina]|uniref:VOC family protein n=1 Tax=Sneathiella marina TaxID=2950108 RepID=A0ABY4W1L9_9PROT|nr:VOC family protein [Sneathiella marina]USG61050.1 VOC family protein [Sneathiella marina]
MPEISHLQHVNILVDDLNAGIEFYTKVVGLELDTTPDLPFPAQFFKLAYGGQIHMNEIADIKPVKAHFCLVVDDFNTTFRRMKAAGVIDIVTMGKIRRLPAGTMQMFIRDPSENLVEIASKRGSEIDNDVLQDDMVSVGNGDT